MKTPSSQSPDVTLTNLNLEPTKFKEKQDYFMFTIRFNDNFYVNEFKKISNALKSRGLKNNQDVFAYMVKCTIYVLKQLENNQANTILNVSK